MTRHNYQAILSAITTSTTQQTPWRATEEFTAQYFTLQDSRADARHAERKGLCADWHCVYDQAYELLTQHFQHPDLMAWFIDAALRVDATAALPGLFQLWHDYLQSVCVDGELDEMFQVTKALFNSVKTSSVLCAINHLPISQNYAFWQYQNISSRGDVTLASIQEDLHVEDAEHYHHVSSRVAETIKVIQALSVWFNDMELDIQLSPLEQTLLEYQFALTTLYEQPKADAVGALAEVDTSSEQQPRMIVTSRQQVLTALQSAADYFQEHEPHSPIPDMLARIINWANLPFSALLNELIDDNHTLNHIYKTTGIKTGGSHE